MGLTLVQKAKRFPSGRIEARPGVLESPPVLIPRVLHMMSADETARLVAIQEKRVAVQRESMAFLSSLGLRPTGQYVFHKSGAVTERGRHRPIY